MANDEDIVKEFLIESYENLDQLDQELVELENTPKEINLLSSIFRVIHTIKGTCGFLGYSKLESITHVGESLLSKMRDGELNYNRDIASALLSMVDAVRQVLFCIDNDRDEGDVDYSQLVELLTELQNQEAGSTSEGAGSESSEIEEKQSSGEGQEFDEGAESFDIVNEFLLESNENLDQVDQDLVALEKNPKDKNLISSIFRTIHTIKGTCGFLGFSKLESITHVSESLLGKVREDELHYTHEIASTLLSAVDAVRQILFCIETDRNEGDVDYYQLVNLLTDLQNEEESQSFVPTSPESLEIEEASAGETFATSDDPDVSSEETEAVSDDLEVSSEETYEIEIDSHTEDGLEKTDAQKAQELLDSLGPKPKPPTEPTETTTKAKGTGKTLYENLGKSRGVEATADIFYTKLMADDRVSGLFDGLDISFLREKGIAFLTYVFGGATQYGGKSLQEAYTPLKAMGLNNDDFDAVMENLEGSLDELGVPEFLINEVSDIAETLRDIVLSATSDAQVTRTPVELVDEVKEAQVKEPASNVDSDGAPKTISKSEDKKPEYDGPDRRGTNADKEGAWLAKGPDRRTASDSSIRVDVDILDKLMNLVGELVLARNQILQYATEGKDSVFTATTQHLNLITSELQENVMQTRMQPIGNIWSKLPRVVRDLSVSCGKKVILEMEGRETELDKTLIEAIKDPLTHIVRNSIDHGIEDPEERLAHGKSEEGVLRLRSYHEGGQVIIEITDDGGGIDPRKIKRKALEKNLITPDQAAKMGDREALNLIFTPGLSTADKVTNVSGRGVGMDVVRNNIEHIGGTVDISSQLGEGTALKVKIPLTLAIIPALIINCGVNRYAIPQVSLLELLRLDRESEGKIENIQGTPVYRLRGNLLPLVYLNEELESEADEYAEDLTNIVVLQAEDRQFGLVVDSIMDTEEIVVKPLGKQMKGIAAYAGSTIMGDGKVALILDVLGLAQKAHVVTETVKEKAIEEVSKVDEQLGDRQTLLVINLGETGRMAVPLAKVARLEEVNVQDIEVSGEQEVVQYRGEIMPLISLGKFFGSVESRDELDILQVVVFTHEGKSIGMIVGQIIDIVDELVTVTGDAFRFGIEGKAVIAGKVTDMLDVDSIIQSYIESERERTALIASSGSEL
jgi:two-component system chemotaxis sensor kinase CheA